MRRVRSSRRARRRGGGQRCLRASARSRLSVSSWRISRARPAPSARRTPISRAPGRAASEQKAGDVRAADEQHQPSDDRQQRRRTRRAARASPSCRGILPMPSAWKTSVCANRSPSSGCSAPVCRPMTCVAACACADGHAGLEPGGDHGTGSSRDPASSVPRRCRIDRHPELADECRRPCAAKSARHDAEDFERASAEQDCPPDDRRVAGEARAPRPLGEHDDIGAGIRWKIDAAELRRNAEHRQVVGRCRFARTALPCSSPMFSVRVALGVRRDV